MCTLDEGVPRKRERERERERERVDAFRSSECVSRNFSRKTFHAPSCAQGFLVRRRTSDTLVSLGFRGFRTKFLSPVCMLRVSCRSRRTVVFRGRRDVIRFQCFSVFSLCLVSVATIGRKRFARANGRKMCECGDECAEDTLNRQLARRPVDLRV